MTRKESPVPQNAPRPLQPCAPQGGGPGIHGSSPHHLGGCRQGQTGPRVRQDHASGRQGLAQSRQGRGHERSGLPGGPLRKSHRSPPRGMQPQGQSESPNDGTKSHIAPETRPGVRVDQATARLTRAQKLKVELEEKLLEVEQAAQDNLTEIAAANAELENAKRALMRVSSQAPQPQTLAQPVSPSAGSSLQNSKGFCSPVRKAWPQIQKKRKEQNGVTALQRKPRGRWCHPGGRPRGGRHGTKASQTHRMGRREARRTQSSPSRPGAPNTSSPGRWQCRCHHERCHPPRNGPAHGTDTNRGGPSQSSFCGIQSSFSPGIRRAPRGHHHTHMKSCQGSKGLLARGQGSKGLLAILVCYLSIMICQEPSMPNIGSTVAEPRGHVRQGRALVPSLDVQPAAKHCMHQPACMHHTQNSQDAWLPYSHPLSTNQQYSMTLENVSGLGGAPPHPPHVVPQDRP